jgi:uncharacterized protein
MGNWLFFIGIPMLLGLWAQMRVTGAFRRYAQVPASSGMTGADAARAILDAAQIHDVEVQEVNGMLGDHYDPTSKRLCLSTDVFHTPSVAAVGIAAHETGHAIQHARAYAPLKARMAIVPVTMITSKALPIILIGSFLLPIISPIVAIKLIVICYLVLTVFQLITLPVEYDASHRAKIILQQMNIVRTADEAAGVNRVLDAAALTYVAAFIASLGTLLYYLNILNRRSN